MPDSSALTCFVAQPFREPFQGRFDEDVRPAIEAAGLAAYKVDKDLAADKLIEDIHAGIQRAAVVLVDITEDNPNVWYELGYSQALGKPLVMISCSTERGAEKPYPFDVRGRKVINYQTGRVSYHEKLRRDVTERITALLARGGATPVSPSPEPPGTERGDRRAYERCRSVIILPAWEWVNRALGVAADWPNHSVWPLVPVEANEQKPGASFNEPFTWHYRRLLWSHAGTLRAIRADPQYRFAAEEAYPHALEPAEQVLAAVDDLAHVVREEIANLAERVAACHPPLQRLPPNLEGLPTELGYALAEVTWGHPRAIHTIAGDSFTFCARWVVRAPELLGLDAVVNALVTEGPWGRVPSAVLESRARVEDALRSWREKLWYAVELDRDTP